jgi:hypothetical protein
LTYFVHSDVYWVNRNIEASGNTGCGVLKWGRGANLRRFLQKINITKVNYWIFQIGAVGRVVDVDQTEWMQALHQFEKFNNLLWLCWFFAEIFLSLHPSPTWEPHNPYYHWPQCFYLPNIHHYVQNMSMIIFITQSSSIESFQNIVNIS